MPKSLRNISRHLVLTSEGRVITGLLISQDEQGVTIFDGSERRFIAADDIEEQRQLSQSSMPKGSPRPWPRRSFSI
jgi:hypothetical protein